MGCICSSYKEPITYGIINANFDHINNPVPLFCLYNYGADNIRIEFPFGRGNFYYWYYTSNKFLFDYNYHDDMEQKNIYPDMFPCFYIFDFDNKISL